MAYVYNKALQRRVPRNRGGFTGFGADDSGWWPTDTGGNTGGDWKTELTAGLSKPEEAIARGEAHVKDLASKGWDKAKTEAYDYFYLQGRNLLEQMEKNPTLKQTRAIGDAAFRLLKSGQGILDSNGVADKVAAIKNFSNGMVALTTAIAPDDTGPASLIIGWVSTGIACGASFAAGPISGAIGCVGALIVNILKSIMTEPIRLKVPRGAPYALFIPQNKQQVAVQSDALRLATVLRFHYGINSIEPLVEYSKALPHFNYESGYPPPPDIRNGAFGQPEKPVPAVDPLALALICSYIDYPTVDRDAALLAINSALDVIAEQTCDSDWDEHTCRGHWDGLNKVTGVSKLKDAYATGDINAAAFEAGASIARGFIVNNKAPSIDGVPGGIPSWRPNFAPFIRVDELINYFVAISLRDIDDTTTNEPDKAHRTYLAGALPVRLWDSPGPDGKPYDLVCWTRLNRGCAPFRREHADEPAEKFCNQLCGEELLKRVLAKEPLALREYALIRLMAAFSHLVVSYRWTAMSGNTPADLIAHVAVPSRNTPAWMFQAPVDPRQAIRNGDNWSLPIPPMTPAEYFETTPDIAPYAFAPNATMAESDIWIKRNVKIPAFGIRYWGDAESSTRSIRTRALLDGQVLAQQIAAHEARIRPAVQAALAQAEADKATFVPASDVYLKTSRFFRPEQTTGFHTVGGKTLLERMYPTIEAKRQEMIAANKTAPLLWIGAAALLALKFLK